MIHRSFQLLRGRTLRRKPEPRPKRSTKAQRKLREVSISTKTPVSKD